MNQDTWRMRRRFMIVAVAFCMGVIAYVLARDLQSSSAETAVNMAFIIIGTTVSSYVFGAAWEDINKRKTKSIRGLGPRRRNDDEHEPRNRRDEEDVTFD